MSHPACSDVIADWGFYYDFLISIPLFVTLQAALAVRETIYHYRYRERLRKIPLLSRIAYILLVFVGLSWSFVDLFRFLIDPQISVFPGTPACDILVYFVKTLPGIFYGLYLFCILVRLETAFGQSYLSLHRVTVYIFRTFILLIFVAGIAYIFLDHEGGACLALWRPQDTDHHRLPYCTLPMTPARKYMSLVALGLISILNICLLIIFTVKLRTILRNNRYGNMYGVKWKAICSVVMYDFTVHLAVMTRNLYAL